MLDGFSKDTSAPRADGSLAELEPEQLPHDGLLGGEELHGLGVHRVPRRHRPLERLHHLHHGLTEFN